ncbi:HAD family hydrolase [Klebsiella michiganensis]|uniref:HAD family hydrolase n=1 Tax=Klebsiella michiganensis TaxID=1134687 RepID=UPI003DA9A802
MNITPDNTLSVFDFDGTLTRHDSFIPFLRFAFGYRVFTRRIIRMVLPALSCLTGRLTRDELKGILVETFLTGVEAAWVAEQAERFCKRYWNRLMRPAGLLAVDAEISSGAIVTLCSASPVIILRPFAQRLGVKLTGTELEVVNGQLTGRIIGANCRCIQKIIHLEQEYGPLTHYHLRAWGDSRGDYALLSAADTAHWRHFHPAFLRRKYPLMITSR